MNFTTEDYLNYDEMKQLIESEYTHDKATIVCNKLIKYCFVFNDELYVLQQNKTYQVMLNLKASLVNSVSFIIQESHKQLCNKKKDRLVKKYSNNAVKSILKNSNIETYYPQLLIRLTKQNVVFNITEGEIHFNNGYMDVKTKTFQQRTSTHYITKYIQRDYQPSSESQRNSVLEYVKKVYPNKDDLDAILYYFGSALSWKGTNDQVALFLLGKASTGKSFIMELTKLVMGCYPPQPHQHDRDMPAPETEPHEVRLS